MITGKTDVFFMIADPISQVRTPEIFNDVLPLCGIDAVMVPLRVAPEDFVETVKYLFKSPTTKGAVISIPHKTASAGLVDHSSKTAKVANAVNIIRRNADGSLEGDLCDGVGFLRSMDRYQMPYEGKDIFMLGAGGAACAIASALAETGNIASLSIFDPDQHKTEELAKSLLHYYGLKINVATSSDPTGHNLIINASPLGLNPSDPMPIAEALIPANIQVCDILMKNQPTPLLQASLNKGCRVLPGYDMLILQAHMFFDFFGLPTAAEFLRHDDAIARDRLFPQELRHLAGCVI